MHVLGTPPAFTLSQDQTLHHEEFGPLRDSLFYKFVPKGIMCLENAPTEVLFTPLTIPYFWHAYLQIFIPDFHLRNVSAPLCSCSGAQSHTHRYLESAPVFETQKNPRATAACSGSLHKHWPVGFSLLSLSRLLSYLETCEVVSYGCHSEHLCVRWRGPSRLATSTIASPHETCQTSNVNATTTSREVLINSPRVVVV